MKPPKKPTRSKLTNQPVPESRQSTKVVSYDVSADSPAKPLPPPKPRSPPTSLTRSAPTRHPKRTPVFGFGNDEPRVKKVATAKATVSVNSGAFGVLDEAERLERVIDATLALEATVSKRNDASLVEDLIAAVTCHIRAEGPFVDLMWRQQYAVRNELLYRLAMREAVALGRPPPVRITKERPVYGKDVDARPVNTTPNKSRRPKQTPAERAMGLVPGQKPAELGPISRAIRQAGEEMRGTAKKVAVPVKPGKPLLHKPLPPVKPKKR